MNSRHGRNRAFTIVELLVVIGIITILMGMLLPSLQGVQNRSRKAKEITNIRQVGYAWTLYSNSNDSAALPGYLGYLEDQDVQSYWQVTYEYPDGSVMPPAFAAPWTWRLLPYLDNALVMVHGYRDLVNHDIVQDWDPDVEVVDPVTHNNRLLGELIASEPAFGYNAFYVGGWWDEMVDVAGPGEEPREIPRYRYWDTSADRNRDGTPEPVSVVARYPSQITRPSHMVIFCSSAELSPQLYRKWPANRPGAHVVVPPILADEQQWRAGLNGATAPVGASASVGPTLGQADFEVSHGAADPRAVLVVGDVAEAVVIDGPSTWAPIGRHTRLAAVLYADGHADTQSPAALADQTKWIYAANGDRHFVHSP